MNILLWVLQVMLALHTIMGAVWKFSNSEQTIGSLNKMPHQLWVLLGVIEIICSICLILPAINKQLAILAPLAAIFIIAEMLLYCLLTIFSNGSHINQLIYWLVVAVLCTFIVYGRFVLKPL